MNKVLKYVCLALLVAGVVVAHFSDLLVVDISALAVAFVSAGALCASTYKKSEKKDWKVILSIALVAVGAVGLGIAAVSTNTVTTVIAAVAGLLTLLGGIVTSVVLTDK